MCPGSAATTIMQHPNSASHQVTRPCCALSHSTLHQGQDLADQWLQRICGARMSVLPIQVHITASKRAVLHSRDLNAYHNLDQALEKKCSKCATQVHGLSESCTSPAAAESLDMHD